jgi:hypothetical protein
MYKIRKHEDRLKKFWLEKNYGKITSPDTHKYTQDNIKMYLRKVECECVNWFKLDQERVKWRAFVNTEMNLWFLYKGKVYDQVNNCSRKTPCHSIDLKGRFIIFCRG